MPTTLVTIDRPITILPWIARLAFRTFPFLDFTATHDGALYGHVEETVEKEDVPLMDSQLNSLWLYMGRMWMRVWEWRAMVKRRAALREPTFTFDLYKLSLWIFTSNVFLCRLGAPRGRWQIFKNFSFWKLFGFELRYFFLKSCRISNQVRWPIFKIHTEHGAVDIYRILLKSKYIYAVCVRKQYRQPQKSDSVGLVIDGDWFRKA